MGWRLPLSATVESDDPQKRLKPKRGWRLEEVGKFYRYRSSGFTKLIKSENYQCSTCRFKEFYETLPFITGLMIIFHHRTYICMLCGCRMTNFTASQCTSTTDFSHRSSAFHSWFTLHLQSSTARSHQRGEIRRPCVASPIQSPDRRVSPSTDVETLKRLILMLFCRYRVSCLVMQDAVGNFCHKARSKVSRIWPMDSSLRCFSSADIQILQKRV